MTSNTGSWPLLTPGSCDGKERMRLCVHKALDLNFAKPAAVGASREHWKVRMEEVRNFMSSRISAMSIEREKVAKMSRNLIPEGRRGDSRSVG